MGYLLVHIYHSYTVCHLYIINSHGYVLTHVDWTQSTVFASHEYNFQLASSTNMICSDIQGDASFLLCCFY